MEDKIRAYSNLLTTINHEIRPPLNVICGFSEILQEEIETLSDEHKDMLISIERSAKEAISVFNDLIDASIITINDNIKIRPEQVDLIQILKRTESHLNDEHWLAKYHHINFMIESKEQQINIEADTLTENKKFLNGLCNGLIKSGVSDKIKWTCESRVDTVDEDALRDLFYLTESLLLEREYGF